jgi:hypothetical protein
MEVEVNLGGEKHRVLFKYDTSQDGRDAMMSLDKGDTWMPAGLVQQALAAFSERNPFAFEPRDNKQPPVEPTKF